MHIIHFTPTPAHHPGDQDKKNHPQHRHPPLHPHPQQFRRLLWLRCCDGVNTGMECMTADERRKACTIDTTEKVEQRHEKAKKVFDAPRCPGVTATSFITLTNPESCLWSRFWKE